MTTRADHFLRAGMAAMEARAVERDQPDGERSMARAVAIFTAWTGHRLTEADGWRFMVALKQAREIQGRYTEDDYTDLAGYAGLLGECESGDALRGA